MSTETKEVAARKYHWEELGEYLTVDELAGLLQVKRAWIYQRIHAGTMPFPMTKVGPFLRFPASGVRKVLESKTRQPGCA